MRKRTEIDRRKFLIGTAALAGASVAAPAILRAADKELRILTWEGYAEPEWLDPFKQATGATVNIVYSGSADEVLKSGSEIYDTQSSMIFEDMIGKLVTNLAAKD